MTTKPPSESMQSPVEPVEPAPSNASQETGSHPITRRAFLGAAAGGALVLAGCSRFPTIVPRHVLGGRGFVAPSEKVRIAGIGVGGRGFADFHGLAEGNVAVAVCDANQHCMDDIVRGIEDRPGFPNAKKYLDYREMLETEADNIDAVMVAAPDHVHAPASIAAMRLGKHVFTEKPLCQNLHETGRMLDVARETGVVTAMGIQGHATEYARILSEWIEQGAIGNPTEVQIWTDRPIWPQAIARPAESEPVPEGLDWNLWLGPAAERPYHSGYAPFNWRGWCDFGTGALGDMGCHGMDASFWALGLGEPTRVELQTSGCNLETYPEWTIVTYHFPRTWRRGPIKVTWFDGKKQPPLPPELAAEGRTLPENGQLLIGDEGKILADIYGGEPRLLPETAMRQWLAKKPKKTLPRFKGTHYEQFIQACRGIKQPFMADYEYSAALTRMVLIGNLAVLSGRDIEWSARRGRVTNHPEANRFLTREYRKGWEV